MKRIEHKMITTPINDHNNNDDNNNNISDDQSCRKVVPIHSLGGMVSLHSPEYVKSNFHWRMNSKTFENLLKIQREN